MPALDISSSLLLLGGSLFLLLAIYIRRRRGLQEDAAQFLMASALLTGLWAGLQVIVSFGWLTPLVDAVETHLALYALLLMTLLFLNANLLFLRFKPLRWWWWALGVFLIAGLFTVDANFLNLREPLWTDGQWQITQERLTFGLALVLWALGQMGMLLTTIRAYHQTHQPLHRNRIIYWALALGLNAAADGLWFAGQTLVGVYVRLLATLIGMYVLIRHRPPDVRHLARRSLGYGITTVLTVLIYMGAFSLATIVLGNTAGPWLAGALSAVILALLFNPLLGVAQRFVNRWLLGTAYDSTRALHDYGLTIGNILELERLAQVALGLIHEVIPVRRSALFLIDQPNEAENRGDFRARWLHSLGEEEWPTGQFPVESALVVFFREEPRPLSQYDIDLLPRFAAVSADERHWLTALKMDVYVPIHAKGEWVGLFALGPKVSGDRYFDDDLLFLSTLADQTAAALENARLVTDLRQANENIQLAYAKLEQANHQLQELDKLKSSFLGVVTHELRTPFANIDFSLKLIERYGLEKFSAEQRDQMEELSKGVKGARTMVDNLVAFASLVSKQGELHLSDLDFRQVVKEALEPLQFMADRRQIELKATLPDDPLILNADRERLTEAVHHLLHNALKFTETNGKVTVACWATEVSVTFEVKDTGVGLEPEKLKVIWDSFAQLADPLKRGVEGLGLGLALVKYVVNAHHGEVWAHSKMGAGSTFGFYVPLTGPDVAHSVASENPSEAVPVPVEAEAMA